MKMQYIYKYKTFKELDKILTLTLAENHKMNTKNTKRTSDITIYRNKNLWNLKLVINTK